MYLDQNRLQKVKCQLLTLKPKVLLFILLSLYKTNQCKIIPPGIGRSSYLSYFGHFFSACGSSFLSEYAGDQRFSPFGCHSHVQNSWRRNIRAHVPLCNDQLADAFRNLYTWRPCLSFGRAYTARDLVSLEGCLHWTSLHTVRPTGSIASGLPTGRPCPPFFWFPFQGIKIRIQRFAV